MAINFPTLKAQYGVGIAIFKSFCDAIKEIERFDDQSLKLTTISAERTHRALAAKKDWIMGDKDLECTVEAHHCLIFVHGNNKTPSRLYPHKTQPLSHRH